MTAAVGLQAGSVGRPNSCQRPIPPASGKTRTIPRRFNNSATRALDTSLGQVQ